MLVKKRIGAELQNKHEISAIEEEGKWGDYARGAVYALKKRGYNIQQVIKLND